MAIFRGTGGQGDSTTDTTVTTVTEKAAEAASSATSAANSATSAANSASSASTSETNAATSETNAATSESNAASSATTASNQADQASTFAGNAANSAYNAQTFRNETQTLKNQTEGLRDTTVLVATAASNSADEAETAYSNTLAIFGDAQDVQDAVDSASASATTATTKASEAATSATNAANSATSAGTSETNAAASELSASTFANTAGSHANDAQTAQTAAETAQAAAEAAEASINGLYLGSLADDPTLDGNGVAVTTGDLYFNTTAQEVRVYTDGDVWEPVVDLAGDITVNALTSNNDVVVKGNLEVQGTTITVDSATAQTIDLGDNDRIRLGDSDDLQIYHDGTDSYIANSTGTLKLSGNTDVTGNITVLGTVDGRDVAADGATLDAVASTYVDVSGDTLTGDLAFGDNVKAKFGAGDDLQIYHDVSYSYVSDQGTGDLLLQGNNLRLVNYPWTKNYLTATNGGHVNLYYDGAVKLSTTSSGVDVTGTLVADGLTVDGNGTFDGDTSKVTIRAFQPRLIFDDKSAIGGGSDKLILQSVVSQANGDYEFVINNDQTSATDQTILKLYGNGDISFYDDSGTSEDFYWDASTSKLGLGTTTPSGIIHATSSGVSTFVFEGADVGEGTLFQIRNATNNSATGNGHRLEFVHGNNNSRNVFFRTSSTGTFGRSPELYIGSQNDSGGAELDHVRIRAGGDVSFYNDDSTSEDFYWDASTSRLGIGTTTPSAPLTVDTSAGTFAVEGEGGSSNRISSTGALVIKSGNFHTEIQREDGVEIAQFVSDTGDVIFYSDTPSQDFYWDASTSRLGLGTTSPLSDIHIAKSAPIIRMQDTDTNAIAQILYNTAGGGLLLRSDVTQATGTSGSNIIFQTDGSEAARIDSSGNLLVGRTANSTTDYGTTVSNDGYISTSRNGNPTAFFNRQNSDGNIVEFRKDGSTVGSIGTYNDQIYIGRDDTGIRFTSGDDALLPVTANSGAPRSGAIDLGRSYSTFRNLYLSGGVYLGGTGDLNKLDDYEEGTWTPVFTPATGSFTTMTMDVVTATYTKIGDTVRINCFIRTDDVDVTGASGAISISGLPFAANSYNSLAVGYALGWATNKNPVGAYTNSNTSEILITEQTAIGGATSSATVDSFATGTNANYNRIIVTGVYTTNA